MRNNFLKQCKDEKKLGKGRKCVLCSLSFKNTQLPYRTSTSRKLLILYQQQCFSSEKFEKVCWMIQVCEIYVGYLEQELSFIHLYNSQHKVFVNVQPDKWSYWVVSPKTQVTVVKIIINLSVLKRNLTLNHKCFIFIL